MDSDPRNGFHHLKKPPDQSFEGKVDNDFSDPGDSDLDSVDCIEAGVRIAMGCG